MATLTIRQVDDKIKAKLRIRAAHHGHSMEEEARSILRAVLESPSQSEGNLAVAVRRRFAPFGGINLEPPRRDAVRPAPKFRK